MGGWGLLIFYVANVANVTCYSLTYNFRHTHNM